MALGGLWENWHSLAGKWVRSFAIVTTTPNELCAELHNRMPVVLAPDACPAWLGRRRRNRASSRRFSCPIRQRR
jgi:putative SOS response-associated peptidase YedK